MKKLLMLLTFVPIQLFAQFDMDSFSTTNQILIENSVKNCLFITKQSFQIQNKKTKEIFGLGGKEVFGISYTLGFKTNDGCIISDEALYPWKYNQKFSKYESDYTPIKSNSEYSEVSDTPIYRNLTVESNPLILGDSLLYDMTTKCFESNGFEIDSVASEKNGWLVWIYSKNGQNFDESTELNYIISRQTYIVDQETKCIKENIIVPRTNGQILGGIYIVPDYGFGKVLFKLCGILVENDKKWNLLTPFFAYKKTNEKVNADCKTNDNTGEDELTPVIKEKKSKSKKKKNEQH